MRNYWSDLTADELREHMQVSMAQLERACQIRSSCEAEYAFKGQYHHHVCLRCLGVAKSQLAEALKTDEKETP